MLPQGRIGLCGVRHSVAFNLQVYPPRDIACLCHLPVASYGAHAAPPISFEECREAGIRPIPLKDVRIRIVQDRVAAYPNP